MIVRNLFLICALRHYVGGKSIRAAENELSCNFRIAKDSNSELSPCYGNRQMKTFESTWAQISQSHGVITLRCEGRKSLRKISWWFYKCPRKNFAAVKIFLSPSSVASKPKHHELQSFRIGDFLSSSLRIDHLNDEETAGLYRCDAHPKYARGKSDRPISHYFIVGEKKALRNCFATSNADHSDMLLTTIRNFVRTTEEENLDSGSGRTYEYILKIPSGETQTLDYKIRFSRMGNNDVKGTAHGSHNTRNNQRPQLLDVLMFDASDAINRPTYL